MANYVLVHGAWSGSWGWTRVARALRAAGHEAWTPSLTGLGERSHLASPAIDLTTHIRDVANVFDYEELGDVILVGHSYGGMVITGLAGLMPDRIRALVYLDAFLPKDGQSLWDLVGEEGQRNFIDAQRDTPGLVAPFFAAPGERRRPLSSHPLLTLTQPVATGGAEQRIANRTYIYATRDAPTTFTRFHDQLKDDPAWKVRAITTGHVVMADDPDGLVALLLEEAER